MADEKNEGQYQLRSHQLAQYMRMDRCALRASNIFPGPNDGKFLVLIDLNSKLECIGIERK
jgi:hypothetical protein